MNEGNVIYSKLPDGSIFCHTNGLLYKNYDEFENAFFNVEKDILIKKLESLEKENNNLQSKIDKAIEFINSQKKTISKSQADLFNEDKDNKSKLKIGTFMWNVDELLNILKEDK